MSAASPAGSPAGVPSPAAGVAISGERLILDWRRAYSRALAYLAFLGAGDQERVGLALRAIERAAAHAPPERDETAAALEALREMLPELYPAHGLGSRALFDRYLTWRLERALARVPGPGATPVPSAAATLSGGGRLASAPPLARRAMLPASLRRRFGRGARQSRAVAAAAAADRKRSRTAVHSARKRLPWTRVALGRRLLLLVLISIPSVIASGFMLDVLPHQGRTVLEVVIVALFGALFGWISIGFWAAVLGFLSMVGRGDRFRITRLLAGDALPEIDPAARTAVVMPICNEPVERTFAGLRATRSSLTRAGALAHFDFFILSDTDDPDGAAEEERAWAAWCRETDGFGSIFYRRRRVRRQRKSGNVADFCRRWGRKYRYMIMLDADSVMAGSTLMQLVALMERQPDAGLIQTLPVAVQRRSLFGRVQQFTGAAYAPMFAAGLHWLQLGDGQYWGHNAILRVAPFTDHCGLPVLPGRPPLGGEILSHDFVESALLGRAGWTIWLAFDLGGSYEETPSSLLEEMQRDRRWCQGNLQHLRVLPAKGLFAAHRFLFLNGVLSYVSAMLWFFFLVASSIEAVIDVLRPPNYFPAGPSLFPQWPIWRPDWALSLLAVTAGILFLPKLLSLLWISIHRQRAARFGGVRRLWSSAVLEIVISSLFAPIRMLFHTRFVLTNLLGRTVVWRSQPREDSETRWRDALRHHAGDTLFASAWGSALFWMNPDYFWWVTPVIGALLLSVPLSVYSSRVRLGGAARRAGLFLTPAETAPPQELRDLEERTGEAENPAVRGLDGFVRVVVDPYVNALHRALLGSARCLRPAVRQHRAEMVERALEKGPVALGATERRVLLIDPEVVDVLHERVWSLRDAAAAARWGIEAGGK